MNMNLKTTIKAYPKLSPSILNNYITEAPGDGQTYARKDGQWVSIISDKIWLRYGISPFNIMVDNTFNTIDNIELTPNQYAVINGPEMKGPESFPISQNKINLSLVTPECGGYCWICSSMPLNSINDKATGWALDYNKQRDNVTEVINNSDGTTSEITYYCYCLRDELMGDETFNFTLDVQGDQF